MPRTGVARASHEQAVRRYYAVNTALFRLFGGASGPEPHAVHRLPGTDPRVLEAAAGHASCLDLGCGEGATLALLATRAPALHLAGMTLSPAQAAVARRYFRGLRRPVPIVLRSYLDPESYPVLPSPRLLVAVESMVHASDYRAFLRAAAAYAGPEDTLLVVDDFVAAARGGRDDTRARALIRAVRSGWRAPSLCDEDAFVRAADRVGWRLESGEDRSREVPRSNPAVRAGARLLVRIPDLPLGDALSGLRGGSALLLGYGEGVFRYLYLRFRRAAPG